MNDTTDNVVEAEFKTPDKWEVSDILRQIRKFKAEDIEHIVILYTLTDGTTGLLGSECTVPERVGMLEIAKVMSMSMENVHDLG